LGRIGRDDLFLGWGLTQGVVSWVAGEGEVWLFLNVGRWAFFCFLRNYFFWWCGMRWLEEGGGCIILPPLCFSKYGDLMKKFPQENNL